jgi:hypothetical protein
MKKIKLSLLILAIMAGVGGAFVNKAEDPMCHYYTQYYYNGVGYCQAGQIGYNYDCDQSATSETCTYWEYDPIGHPGEYAACKVGTFIPIMPFE